jgi:serine O-acetyltransferase
MKEKQWNEEKVNQLTNDIIKTYQDNKGINHIEGLNLPNRKKIYDILDKFFMIIFPGYIKGEVIAKTNIKYFVGDLLNVIYSELTEEVEKALKYKCAVEKCGDCDCVSKAKNEVVTLLENIAKLREMLKQDVNAAYAGDPAAHSFDEIILSYPAMEAITTYRIAHELYKSNIPLIPRIMTEKAHSKTGIDIHPGAKIGNSFFIDHGTGVVIGETTDIGDRVKIYQGVTLGALSFKRDKEGKIIKGAKRHPTIEEDVTIYAGATILGGDTIIRKGSVIGGNVWLTESVPENTKITITKPDLLIK